MKDFRELPRILISNRLSGLATAYFAYPVYLFPSPTPPGKVVGAPKNIEYEALKIDREVETLVSRRLIEPLG
jgi:hypothetical protein